MSDKVRDAYTQTLGYITYRIPWNRQNTPKGKIIMQQKMQQLILVIPVCQMQRSRLQPQRSMLQCPQ